MNTPRTTLLITLTGCLAKMANSLEVTPGRSRPVRVMSRVVRGVFIAGARLPDQGYGSSKCTSPNSCHRYRDLIAVS